MAQSYGLWPGIVGFANDAKMVCVECARSIYGAKIINDVIFCREGWQEHTDHEGNSFNVLFANSDDVEGQSCMIVECGVALYDEEDWDMDDMIDEVLESDEDCFL